MRNLGGGPNRDRRLPAIRGRQDAARLDGHARQPLVADPGAHETVRSVAGRLDVTPEPKGLASTGDPRFNRLWTLMGVPCVNVPAIVVDGGLPVGAQVIARFGDDEADQVTSEADLGRIEQRSIRQAAPFRAADGKARCVCKLSGGNDRDDSRSGAGRRDVDRFDGGVRHVAADENQVAEPGGTEIIDVGAGAGDQARVFTAPHPRPQAVGERHAPQLT